MSDGTTVNVDEPVPKTLPQETDEGGEDSPLLAGKFKTPADLEKAYTELQSAYGRAKSGQTEPAPTTPPTGGPRITEEFLKPFEEEFARSGELSEESLAKLEGVGIDRRVAMSHVASTAAGRQAAQANYTSEVMGVAGGQEEYGRMVQWAKDHLSDAEKRAYSAQVESGDLEAAKFAARGLMERYRAESGGPSSGMTHGRPASGGNAKPFRSLAELIAAQRDERYRPDTAKYDPTYRQEVMERAAASPNL